MENRKFNIMDIFNEVVILIVAGSMYVFTDEVTNVPLKLKFGNNYWFENIRMVCDICHSL